ncbi:NADase-type glycan-binding domain-containing protein [Tessaracoccus lacteus]|uniref:NAD glycohydrolase translocation F5/8 type C domain-containing protein n=1 Tax=Tessaracoccus lacteus TaxID=3041766 RepID=A0ABY8PZ07_9ACTN|nr:hypothetical protein [Tessaracoccus sp. T21]WGT47714.1 hypothetical protein QH948_02765 [Tessaracoccus sp. T21]
MVLQVPDEAVRKSTGGDPRPGVEPRLLVLMLAIAVVAGFFGGRLVLIRSDSSTTGGAEVISSSPLEPANSVDDGQYTPYTGVVKAVTPDSAEGKCSESQEGDAPAALIDQSDTSIWRCRGEGIGETAVFEFDEPVTLAALRVVNGNTAWTDRYTAERRITAIRWTFDDGSFFDQGLAPNDRDAQEVRFPETETTSIAMDVLGVTEPGDDSDLSDAVSISSLEFLAPA